LDALFSGAESARADQRASPLEIAFGGGREAAGSPPPSEQTGAPLRGRPATPAATELSLDHVFRHATPSSGSPGQSFSFDQFFSQQAQQDAAAAADEPSREAGAGDNDDIRQFNAWLEGLKKS
jgi:hypothetical protein